MSTRRIACLLTLVVAIPTGGARALDIDTGEVGSAYHASLCPRLESALRQEKFDYRCVPTAGGPENVKRVLADPRQIGFAQLDVLASGGMLAAMPPQITIIRRDDVRECVFAVTRNKDVNNFGELSAHADKLRFILPPADGGAAATFRYLQAIDADGLGRAKQIRNATSSIDAVRQGLSADDTVTLFVELPDPEGETFTVTEELGGHFVPVIDRAILRQHEGGEKIFYAQEAHVLSAGWSRMGKTVVTACTPVAIFTGVTERIAVDKDRQDHRDLIATVRAMKAETLIPEEGALQRLWRRTREMSGASVEELVKRSDEAREKAGPLIDRAKDAGSKAMEAAKPAIERATEAGRQALDKAEKEAKELIEKSKSRPPASAPKDN